PGQGPDVVFMAMRQDDGLNPLSIFDEVGNVWYDDVHAEQFCFGEHQARVNHDNVVAPAYGHAVHSELPEAAQRHDLQFSSRHSLYFDRSTGKQTNPAATDASEAPANGKQAAPLMGMT